MNLVELTVTCINNVVVPSNSLKSSQSQSENPKGVPSNSLNSQFQSQSENPKGPSIPSNSLRTSQSQSELKGVPSNSVNSNYQSSEQIVVHNETTIANSNTNFREEDKLEIDN